MAILGLLVILASGAFLASAFFSSNESATFTMFGMSSTMNVGTAVLIGAIAGAALLLGIGMLFGGVGRAARRRHEAKQVVRDTQSEADQLRAENERLAREIRDRDSVRVPEHTVVIDRPVSTGTPPVTYPAEPLARDDVRTGRYEA